MQELRVTYKCILNTENIQNKKVYKNVKQLLFVLCD